MTGGLLYLVLQEPVAAGIVAVALLLGAVVLLIAVRRMLQTLFAVPEAKTDAG